MYVLQEILQVNKFFVGFVKFKGDDWNTIAELVAEAPYSIVNQYHVFESDIVNDSEVFNINVIRCFDAAFSVKSMLE